MSDVNPITSTTDTSNVVAFTGKETVVPGFRLSILRYKATKDDKGNTVAAKPSVCVPVPAVVVSSVSPEVLRTAIQDAVNDLQDSLVRKLIDDDGKTMLSHTSVNADAVAAFASEQSAGKRLNKEVIGNWFDSHLQDKLMDALIGVLGFGANPSDVQVTKLMQAVSLHRSKVCELAAPRPAVTQSQAISLLKAVNLADSDDSIKLALVQKLDLLSKPRDAEFFGL